MRVPDFPGTAAGYAAILPPNNHPLPATPQSTASYSPQPAQLHHRHKPTLENWSKGEHRPVALPKKHAVAAASYLNGNTPFYEAYNQASSPRNPFDNSADEFVQKALNSHAATPTQLPAYGYDYYSSRQSSSLDYAPQTEANSIYAESNQATTPDVNELYALEANSENTYRSFKEIFNNNKTFFEECVKDFENINTLRHLNEDYYDEEDEERCTSPLPASIDDCCFQDDITAIQTLDNEQQQQYDADDQAMNDLCQSNHSTAEVPSPKTTTTTPISSSSSASFTSISQQGCGVPTFYYPRGIINPNYPGFQHLAHTLSEHFIGAGSRAGSTPTSDDTYDSEMSDEYDMELSGDDFDDMPPEVSDELAVETNNNNNNNLDDNVDGGTAVKKAAPVDTNRNTPQHIDIHNLHANLQSTLILLDTQAEDTAETGTTTKVLQPTPTTPDILIKNNTQYLEPHSACLAKENRPDLLRGVSPLRKLGDALEAPPLKGESTVAQCYVEAPPSGCQVDVGFTLKQQRLLALAQAAGCPQQQKDELASFGMTPVDIIGDFGQEVEREFGLLVSGYKRMSPDNVEGQDVLDGSNVSQGNSNKVEKLSDAALSEAKDELNASKYLTALKQAQYEESEQSDAADANETKKENAEEVLAELMDDDSNAVDWSSSFAGDEAAAQHKQPLKYHKASYDERQLPPVVIDYKRCQPNLRLLRKPQNAERCNATKSATLKIARSPHTKTSYANRLLLGGKKRSGNGNGAGDKTHGNGSGGNNNNRHKREDAELQQYQELINDKEAILCNSKYTKLSSWAQYLKNSVERQQREAAGLASGVSSSKGFNGELVSPSALDLFDAYKIGSREMDMETLQQHMKLAKEIEKKRRNDREEIRRRLAMGADCLMEQQQQANNGSNINSTQQQQAQWRDSGLHFCQISEISSDTESHSSDSETCPKLSKSRQLQQQCGGSAAGSNNNGSNTNLSGSTNTSAQQQQQQPYYGRPLSISCTNNNKKSQAKQQGALLSASQQQQDYSAEDKECSDFFTKQARLQIEARMALAQAKEMAHMQMEIDRQNQRMSPITAFIRDSLEKVGVQSVPEKRRVSRQMLTEMNIAQLQILVNNLHSHIEELNESLVEFLMQRDDLHMDQDGMLADIEELTRYIGSREQQAKQQQMQQQQQQQQSNKRSNPLKRGK